MKAAPSTAADSPGSATRGLQAAAYITLNLVSSVGIVFANKLVLSVYNFHFVYALTLVHCLFTMVGMWAFAAVGLFNVKSLPGREVAPLAAAFVGYVVGWNLALQLNPVGFYQLAKILIIPVVVALEAALYGRVPGAAVLAAIAVLCAGVALATVSEFQVSTNPTGVLVAGFAIGATSVYQIWVGAKQKQLQVGSTQLMHQYAPYATGLLAFLVPAFEPLGLRPKAGVAAGDTLAGFPYNPLIAGAILLTAVLGLLVSWSTFLVIGATSSVTYNVVGHLKTVLILTGGCALFGEAMPPQRLAGVGLALAGIVAYSLLKLREQGAKAAPGPTPTVPAASAKLAARGGGESTGTIKAARGYGESSSDRPEEESLLPRGKA